MTQRKYRFLVTATDRNGSRSTQHCIAATATEAVAQLQADGCTDIVLHTDDAGAASVSMTPLDPNSVTPQDSMSVRTLSTLGFFLFLLKKQLRSQWLVSVAALAFIAWTLFQGTPLSILFWISVAIATSPIAIAFYFTFFTATRKYEQLLEAWAWGRWDVVFSQVQKLRGRVPDFELDAREAVALAKTGRVEDGLSRITRHASNPEVPRWMYLGRLAEFYACIERYDLEIEFNRQAYETAPDNPTVALDYAMSQMRSGDNTPETEQIVASAEQMSMSDILKLFLPFARGLQALNNARYSQAQAFLVEAHSSLTPWGVQPLVRLILDHLSAYIAIASIKNGDFDTATKHYGRAKKRLEALGRSRLLSRLNQAMSGVQKY